MRVAISGTWRYTFDGLQQIVAERVRAVMKEGHEIVVGCALGVDAFALNTALEIDPTRIHAVIPTPLDLFVLDYLTRAAEGDITTEQAQRMIDLIGEIARRQRLIELGSFVADISAYERCNEYIIEQSDRLIAFPINHSQGTQHAIDVALAAGKPVEVYRYEIPQAKLISS